MLGNNLNVLLSARKDLPFGASTKMKQLQWDKLPQQQVGKTLWNEEETSKEQEMMKIMQSDGVWMEMEEDFKAKQLVMNLMGLSPFSRINVTSLMSRCLSSSKASRTEKCPRRADQETCW